MDINAGYIKKGQSPLAAKPDENTVQPASEAAFLIHTGQYAQAYIILKDLISKEKSVSDLFNIALCFLQAGKPHDAVSSLEEALNTCKKELSKTFQSADSTTAALEEIENDSDAYKAPLSAYSADNFTHFTKTKIIRLLADACLLSGNRQKLEKLVNNPEYKKYKNIKRAFETVKSSS